MRWPHIHWWTVNYRKYDLRFYKERRCRCGAHQLQHIGPAGDDKWHDINEPWLYRWEAESYFKSVEWSDI